MLSRERAAEIFSMRLEHLGFIDYIIGLSVVVIIMIFAPFLFYCCKVNNKNIVQLLFSWATRIIIGSCLFYMFTLIEIERSQCDDNVDKVQTFNKTNVCSDEYSVLDTYAITGRLGKAKVILDGMELSVQIALVFMAVELTILTCLHCMKKKKTE